MKGATPRIITAAEFSDREQIAGRLSTVAAYRVPRRTVVGLALAQPFRLNVRGKYETTTTNDANTTETFDLGAAGYPFVDPPRADAVVAYVAGSLVTPTAVDADAGTVTVPKTASTTEAVVLYPALGVGHMQLVAASPEGADAREILLYQDSLRALNETDQADSRTAPRLERPGLVYLPLGPRWELRIKAEAPSGVAIEWDTAAKHVARFAAAQASITPAQAAQVDAVIAQKLRG